MKSTARKQKLSIARDDFRKIIGDEWKFFATINLTAQ
jgi:hypothetical protein